MEEGGSDGSPFFCGKGRRFVIPATAGIYGARCESRFRNKSGMTDNRRGVSPRVERDARPIKYKDSM